MRIQIIYIATGDYCNYAGGFIDSLRYFLPETEKKLTLLSDGKLEQYRGYNDGNVVETEIKYLFNLIYPTINLNKPVIINSVIDNTCDGVFYFDADTIFKDCEYDWSLVIEGIENGTVFFTRHPVYLLPDDSIFCGWKKNEWIDNFYTENVAETDGRFSSFIPNRDYDYIITSFWGGNVDAVKNFDNDMILHIRQDLTRYPLGYHVPKYMDENYGNRIIYEYFHGKEKKYDIVIDNFCQLYNIESVENTTGFMYQKNMKNFKTNRQ